MRSADGGDRRRTDGPEGGTATVRAVARTVAAPEARRQGPEASLLFCLDCFVVLRSVSSFAECHQPQQRWNLRAVIIDAGSPTDGDPIRRREQGQPIVDGASTSTSNGPSICFDYSTNDSAILRKRKCHL
jgi:hypothetical protein